MYGKILQEHLASTRAATIKSTKAAVTTWVKENAPLLSTPNRKVEIRSTGFSLSVTPYLMAQELAQDPNFEVLEIYGTWYARFRNSPSSAVIAGPTYQELETLLNEIESECRSAIELDFPRQGIKSIFEAICRFNKWDFQTQWDRALDGKDAEDD